MYIYCLGRKMSVTVQHWNPSTTSTNFGKATTTSVFVSYLSKHTAPRLKSSWVVFHPKLSDPRVSPCDSNSYLSARASVTAASASIGGIQSNSWPSSPRVRWKVSLREPALETTALKSCGRIEVTLGRDRVVPCGDKRDYVKKICR